jgi:hypothetical protein
VCDPFHDAYRVWLELEKLENLRIWRAEHFDTQLPTKQGYVTKYSQ